MTFPIVNYKTNHNEEVTEHLKDLTEHKLRTLEKFIADVPAVCDVEFEKVTKQQSGDIYRVEVNLEVNGKLYRADAVSENFEKSVDEVRNELDKELRRAHDKKDTLLKRGGRRLKNMLNFGG